MIYVCIPSYNEAPTVGLLLWKLRRILGESSREYEMLVLDDASADHTAEVLEPYTKVLPLTVVRHAVRQGYGRSVEELLRLAVERTDRPKRDCAIILHADFTHAVESVPELIKRIESGADVVIGEATVQGEPSRAARWLRRGAPYLLRGVRIPGVRDIVSGFGAIRLVSLRNAFRAYPGQLLTTDGWAANAELFGRAAQHARRVDTVPVVERHDLRQRPSRLEPWPQCQALWRYGRRLRIQSESRRDAEAPARRAGEAPALEEAAR